ncbi:probable G-protein coupled receptor 139 [Mercenaria mercenaria]|uniref:probable G-protein coupled receptor 139 n=1 Tax=Mercenaria mercenaria TaxID=6596 RepID=UPI00234E64F2|nr:probable G-protein coupled receptor 139 [Mercenaria mercenaria]
MANMSNTTTSVQYKDYTKYAEYKAGILIWKIIPPILIILGTVGNGLSILVLTRRSIRTSTTALFLTVLAFSDLVVLYSGLLRQWLIYLFDIDVREISQFGCKLNIWLVYSSLDFSAWILVGVTLERVVSAWLPHSAQTLCSRRSAAGLIISLGIFILAFNAHLLYGMVFKYTFDHSGHAELQKCVEVNNRYKDFFNVTWPWIDLCAFCLIPLTVIVMGNWFIVFKLINSQRRVHSRVVPSSAVNGRGPTTTPGPCGKPSSATAMLFTLNIVFLFSTLPISIYNIGYIYWTEGANERDHAQLDLWWAIVNMLMYVNNSINFFLYCLSGAKFRREAIRIFCPWKQNRVNVIGAIRLPADDL